MHMYTVRDVYDFLDKKYPFDTSVGWDNTGLLAGDADSAVTHIAVALDITAQTVLAAHRLGCELIVSHHPVIFHPLRALAAGSAPYLLARHGISAVCAHTNLDMAPGGVNDALAGRLGLADITPIHDKSEEGAPPLARAGRLPSEMTASAFALHVKERLGCASVCLAGTDRVLRTAAVCSGAGSGYILDYCMGHGIDALVTGEAKHHEYIAAAEAGFVLITAGHFCTERVVCAPLADALRAAFPAAEVTVMEEHEPYRTL